MPSVLGFWDTELRVQRQRERERERWLGGKKRGYGVGAGERGIERRKEERKREESDNDGGAVHWPFWHTLHVIPLTSVDFRSVFSWVMPWEHVNEVFFQKTSIGSVPLLIHLYELAQYSAWREILTCIHYQYSAVLWLGQGEVCRLFGISRWRGLGK